MADFTFTDYYGFNIASKIVCDPRLAYSTHCFEHPHEWHHALDYWFTVLAVYLMIVSMSGAGYVLLKFGRTGFNLSLPYLLPIIQSVAGFIALARVFLIIGTKGNWFHHEPNDLLWVNELLYSMSFTMSIYGYVLLILFFENLFEMKSGKNFKAQTPKQIYRRTFLKSLYFAIPLALGTAAATILTGNNPEEYRLPSYLVTVSFTVGGVMFVSYRLVKSQPKIEDLLKKDIGKFRRIRMTLLIGAVLWMSTSFFYSVWYNQLLSFHSPWPWMVMMGLQYVYFGINISIMGALTLSKEFTDRGIEKFKPTMLVTMDKFSVKDVSVRAISSSTSRGRSQTSGKSEHSGKESDSATDSMTEGGNGTNCDLCLEKLEANKFNFALARDMPWWRKKPESIGALFRFPHPVNENDSRMQGACASLMMIAIWISAYSYDWPWLYIILIYGFAARCVAGPNLDPQAWLVQSISPIFAKYFEPVYVAGPPKQMAQFVGFCFSSTSFILFMCGQKVPAFWVMAVLFSFVCLQCIHNLCAACLMFYLMSVVGLIPKSILEKSVQKFAVRDDEEGAACSMKRSASANEVELPRTKSDATESKEIEMKVHSTNTEQQPQEQLPQEQSQQQPVENQV